MPIEPHSAAKWRHRTLPIGKAARRGLGGGTAQAQLDEVAIGARIKQYAAPLFAQS
ncbi:MAG: hypothetical protein U0X20_18435 [Caldilineaceae bacterium]